MKNEIRSGLSSAERKLLIDLPEQLSKSMTLANTQELGQHVSNWIKHGQCNAFVDYLCTAIYERKIEQLSRFGNNLKKLGVNLDAVGDAAGLNESDSGCKWVPATFSQLDGRRAYGGVFLRPKLNSQNKRGFQGFQASTKNAGSSAGSSKGGSSGGGSSRGDSSRKGSSPPPKPPKNRDDIMKTYGQGKGWPKTPIRVGDTYFGKPNTGKSFYQC